MARRRNSLHELKNTPRELAQYVVAGEKLVFATRRHWAQIIEPVATAIGGLLLILIIAVASADQNVPPAAFDILFVLWGVLFVRAAYHTMLWWTDWFVATTSRLLLSHGIIYKKVAMMPLSKVTDMSYNRSVLGRFLGFGEFVMESAGQDQALNQINYVPHSGELYRQICSEIFHKKVANQVYRPVALLNSKHRASDERGFEPWETGSGNLDIDERPAANFPRVVSTMPERRRPTMTQTQRIDLGSHDTSRLRTVPDDDGPEASDD